jgi:hypothetical protein
VIEIQALARQAQDLTELAHAADDPRLADHGDAHPIVKHRRGWKRKAAR